MVDDLLSEITRRTVEAEAKADAARLEEAEPAAEVEPTPKPKRDWRGKSSAELMRGKGRISSTTDVHTGGAKELK